MKLKDYMSQTEFAMKQLFNSLEHYQNILDDALSTLPAFTYSGSNDVDYKAKEKEFFDKHEKENRYANNKLNQYMGLTASRSVICGSILQIACMLIEKISDNKEEFQFITSINEKAIKFCIGRSVRDTPIGLIIYAARNQYNHWDVGGVNRKIFDHIAKREVEVNGAVTTFKDPSFNLDLEYHDIYADQIMSLMGWNSYTKYKSDMLNMLAKYEKEEV